MTNEEKCKRWKSSHQPTVLAARSLERMKREREAAAADVRRRLARRDAEYAASPCAARVTVEMRDLRNSELGKIVRIETRGVCGIAPRITHFGKC